MPNLDIALTDEQSAALVAHDRSVSLAAGAGCGKTFVLTERFLSYVDPRQLEPTAELGELVAITFTDAAAREMRRRVRDRCWQRLHSAADPIEAAAWQRLMRAMDSARISTIHSFCAKLLRTHAVEAEVDPQFEQIEPAAADLLRSQTVDDYLRDSLEQQHEHTLDLAARLGLANLRSDLVRLLDAKPNEVIARWRGKTPAELVERWLAYYQQVTAPVAIAELKSLPEFSALRSLADPSMADSDRLHAHLTALQGALQRVEDVDPASHELPWRDLVDLARVKSEAGPHICAKKDWRDGDCHSRYSQVSAVVRNFVERRLLPGPPSGDEALEVARLGIALVELTAGVLADYEQRKRERGALEFDDLLEYTQRLLTDPRYPEVRKNLADGTRLLMVDEFQDTDPLQVAIVKAFCGEDWSSGGLFVVGDFKQSIYRFRGAAPEVSTQLREALPTESRLSLTANFRSQPAILNFVNAVFHDQFGDQFTDAYEPLRPSREQLTPEPAVEFLWSPDPPRDGGAKPKVEEQRRREARWIARRIRQLLESNEPLIVDRDQETTRPLQLGDVAILFRALGDVGIYEDALRQQGLDYYLTGGHAFYAQQEIYDVLHLLRSVASAADELSLAGVLRSPIFSLADETLFWLVDQRGSLNVGLFAEILPKQLTTAEKTKVQRAAATLGQLRARKDQLLVADLLAMAIELTGFDATLLCEFLGYRKLANVQKLVEHARTLDQTSPGDLQGFITQLGEFVVRAPKEALAATHAEGNVIRLMTIHMAKGLEFPLVVLADLDRQQGRSSYRPVFDANLGPLVHNSDGDATVGYDLYRAAEDLAEAEERTRLFYVACTRAADYLILSSSMEDVGRPKRDWLKLIGKRFDLESGAIVGSLPTGYATPMVRAMTTEPEISGTESGGQRTADLQALVDQTRKLAKRKLATNETRSTATDPAAGRIAVDERARRNFSFSRLSGKFSQTRAKTSAASLTADDDGEISAPSGGRSRSLQLGNLVHAVLERVDFNDAGSASDWCELLALRLVDDQPKAVAADAARLIDRFLVDERAKQLRAARLVRREVEFLLPWRCKDGRDCYLEGVIDCLYQDAAGDWRVLDYKSNRIDVAAVHDTARGKYDMQMYVYTLAAEQALGTEIAESVLHFLLPGAEYRFVWNDHERVHVRRQVDEAIINYGRQLGD